VDLSVGTDHLWPWAPIPVAAGVAFLLTWWADRERRRPSGALLVSGARVLRSLPRFHALARQRQWSGLLLAVAAVTVTAGTALVMARPQAVEVRAGPDRGRDLMMCLDASGTMQAANRAVVHQVAKRALDLEGDRIGLMVWSGAAVVVVPLTDDPDVLQSGLAEAEEAFATGSGSLYEGIDLPVPRSSLVGDGIASCVDHLPSDPDRIGAVLLSSDNDPQGKPVYSLPAAARVATRRDVVVYGLGDLSLGRADREPARAELEDALVGTGGTLAVVDGDGTVAELVDRIDGLEESRRTTPDQEVVADDPGLGVALCLLGGLLLAVQWGWRAAGRISNWRAT
jgi:hypothetical protein